jgi:light-regulated signal transduction histidine kinase (bacteriophytochrome)
VDELAFQRDEVHTAGRQHYPAPNAGERQNLCFRDRYRLRMDEKTIKHIYDKFYQGDTSHSTEGNGLGMALVKRILELTGAEMQIESTPGKGSTFTVVLAERK